VGAITASPEEIRGTRVGAAESELPTGRTTGTVAVAVIACVRVAIPEEHEIRDKEK